MPILRRMTQAGFTVLFLLMPVFDILRYDTATQELFIFRKVWTLGLKADVLLDHSASGAAHVAFHVFTNAILPWLLVLSFFPLMGFLFGRAFCGWLCPEGALFEAADYLSLKILGRRSLYGKKHNDPDGCRGNRLLYGLIAALLLLTVPPLVGVMLTGFLVAPKTIWHQIAAAELSSGVKAGIIGVWIYMFVTSVLVRHTFCKYVCAAGLMQTLFGWVSPLSLRICFDRPEVARCTDCRGCEKVCFMGVRPRQPKRDVNCVNCGECVAACAHELHGGNLFSYAFGNNAACPASGGTKDNSTNSKEEINGNCTGIKEPDQVSA